MIFVDINYEVCLYFSLFIVTALIVWFKTNAVVEYGSIISKKILWIDEYEEYIKNNCMGTYQTFLSEKKNSFIIRLITCVYCLCFWLSLFSCLKIGFDNFALIYLLSLTFYFSLNKLSDHYG